MALDHSTIVATLMMALGHSTTLMMALDHSTTLSSDYSKLKHWPAPCRDTIPSLCARWPSTWQGAAWATSWLVCAHPQKCGLTPHLALLAGIGLGLG